MGILKKTQRTAFSGSGIKYTFSDESGYQEKMTDIGAVIEITKSGVFTPTNDVTVDVFIVGGGGGGGAYQGGGGGGGYTLTQKGVTLTAGTAYQIVIGSGGDGITSSKNSGKGTRASSGGTSSAFGFSANGGQGGGSYKSGAGTSYRQGGDGGSGGGCGGSVANRLPAGNGGENGSDGATNGKQTAGTGQKTTTRAFGESRGTLYAGGGGGYASVAASGGAGGGANGGESALPNTGGGGGGGADKGDGGNGGSGIVIVRKAVKA